MRVIPVKTLEGRTWNWYWFDTKQKANQTVKENKLAYREDAHDEDGLFCVAIKREK